jgi:hypothetical protein
MNVRPIRRPVPGEHVLAVSPELSLTAVGHWRRRLALFTGRALTQGALQAEQGHRAGMLALRGQSISAGVVNGLEVEIETTRTFVPDPTAPLPLPIDRPSTELVRPGGALGTLLTGSTGVLRPPILFPGRPGRIVETFHLLVNGGYGVCASGEDAVLPQPLRIAVEALPTCGTERQFLEENPDEDETATRPSATLAPRRVGATIGALIARARAGRAPNLPRAGVLVLQPVVAGEIGGFDPDDQCEIDPESFPFEDQQLTDACRLLLYLWPEEWPLPAIDARWRNRLAYEIFERERWRSAGAPLPWEEIGLPLALIGFDDTWRPSFADGAAVVRAGGKPRRRSDWYATQESGLLGARNRFLWQARLEQLAEQLAEPAMRNLAPDALAQLFRYLPPAGLLPKNAIDLAARRSRFFPVSYRVLAAPVPQEQLDAALESAAMLDRYDLESDDEVEILVPVPQAWFEPRLLIEEQIDEEFDRTIRRFQAARDEWLFRRQNLRVKSAVLVEAITGKRPEVPPVDEDPEAIEPEPTQPAETFGLRAAHRSQLRPGMHQHFFEGATRTLAVAAGERLFAYVYLDRENPPLQVMLQWNDGASWDHRAYWGASKLPWGIEGTVSRRRMGDLPEPGRWVRLEVDATEVGLEGRTLSGMAFTLFDGRAAWGSAGKETGVEPSVRDQVWFDTELPTGAAARTDGGDEWEWLRAQDLSAPLEDAYGTDLEGEVEPGNVVHRSPVREGTHQHFFQNATSAMSIAAGDRLYAWVYLDPAHPPGEVMLQWQSGGNWDHRAYWGRDLIAWGTAGTPSRLRAGALPLPGRWTRLEVPAASVGIAAGQSVTGIAFALHDGEAVWGNAGRIAQNATDETGYLIDAKFPTGATANPVSGGNEAWTLGKLSDVEAPRLAAPFIALWNDASLAPLSPEERAKLRELGVEAFIPYLSERADKADDVLNVGFTRLNVNAFRFRQITLGSVAASRLAVSPVFAQIARSESAIAAQTQVEGLSTKLRESITAITPRDIGGIDGGGVPGAGGPRGGTPGGVDPTGGGAAGGGLGPDFGRPDVNMIAPPGSGEVFPTQPGTTTTNPVAGQPEIVATTPETVATTPGLATGGATEFGNIRLEQPGGALLFTRPGALRVGSGSVFGGSVSGMLPGGSVGGFGFRSRERASFGASGGYAGYTAYAAQGAGSKAKAATEPVFLPPPAKSADQRALEAIEAQAPLPGNTAVRSTTIAERMLAPGAEEAQKYSIAARYSVIESLSKLDISLDGISLTGVVDDGVDDENETAHDTFGQPRRPLSIALDDIRAGRFDRSKLLRDRDPKAKDEPNYLAAGIDLADHSIALLRRVEGRVRQYRLAIEACRKALAELKNAVVRADRRLQVIATELAEARHDVGVSKALKAEEQARLDAINARRAQILEEHVKFLAYRRLRWAGAPADAPSRAIDPALTEAPVPACLAQDHEPPAGLRALIDLAREAPARWFRHVRPQLDRIDRVEHMLATLQSAQVRAQVKSFMLPDAGVGKLASALTGVLTAQHQVLAQRKQMLLAVNPAQLAALNWKASRDTAEENVSLADLMEAAHRRNDVARAAANEIESLSRIAACLHAEFAGVLPAIRLDWAESVSQFDAPVSLRNLAGLARWNEIGYTDRRQMQAYVDWLFDRIDADVPEAVGLMNDMVRVCLLLASHAPVNRIIAGRVGKPQDARPGGKITLRPFDLAKVQIGMQALLYSGAQVVGRAVVDDLGTEEVAARVVHLEAGISKLAENMTVHFAQAQALGYTPAKSIALAVKK